MRNTRDLLLSLNACSESLDWCAGKSPTVAWRTCKRADWLLWLAERVGVETRLTVLCDIRCAETARQYLADNENMIASLLALHVAEEWCEGRADEQDGAAAGTAAGAAAWAAAWAAAGEEHCRIIRAIIPWSLIREKLEAHDA